MKFSIILPAYKEKQINKLLKLLLKQSLPKNWKLDKILVVACGYEEFTFIKNKKIRILKESRRRGKAYAMNLALEWIKLKSNPDIIIIQSADTFPKKGMIKGLLKPFRNPIIGISCGRPMSLDSPKNFVGFINNLVWKLHHFVSLEDPKVGEVFAFRNVVKKIPNRLAADESYIESVIKKEGYKVAYAQNAIVFNRGPQTISEFISQRRRIFTGHVHIKNEYHYSVPTMSATRVIKAFLKYLKVETIKSYRQIFWLPSAALLEIYARLLGTIDFYVFNKVPYMWRIVKTSGR